MGIGQSRNRRSQPANDNSEMSNNNNNNNNNSNSDGPGRRQSADSDHEDRGEDSIASLLSFLIRRYSPATHNGQVRLINRSSDVYSVDEEEHYHSDSDEGVSSSASKDFSTKTLKQSDIYMTTLSDSGEFGTKRLHKANNLTKRICHREIGATSNYSFGCSDKCFINNKLLPNKMTKLDTHRSKVFVGQYIKQGRIFVSASQDQKIRFYDSSSGRCFNTIEARDVGWSVLDVAVSPDGENVVYSSWSDYVHQCKVYGDSESHVAFNLEPRDYRFCCFSLRFSSDGNEILAGASDKCLYVYDKQRNCRTLRIEAHEDDVNAVCFADETSKIIYSGGDDGLVKIWDRRTLSEDDPKPVGCLAGHSDGITFIDTKGDARYLISNSKDQCIKLWDVRKCATTEAIRATRHAVAKQSWDYRWQNVPKKGTHRLVDGDTSVMTYCGGHKVLHTLIRCYFSPAFCTGQRFIYCGCADGQCVVYDLLTGKVVTRLKGHQACVRDVSWHPYKNEICTASWDATIGRWTYDGRDEEEQATDSSSDFDGDMSNGDSDDDSGTRRRPSRLLRLYRRQQAPLRRSERIREQRRRRAAATLMF